MADPTQSPIVADDLPDFNPSADVCTKMEQLLGAVGQWKEWLAWAFDSAGNWNDAAIQQIVLAAVPVGVVINWSGTNLPSDKWLVANGSNVSRTTYSELFDAIGTTYGQGDGSTTFALPGTSDKFVKGVGTSGLGVQGGAATVTLTTAMLPEHSHVVPMAKKIGGDTGSGAQSIYGPEQAGFDAADITSEDTGSASPVPIIPSNLSLYFIVRAKP